MLAVGIFDGKFAMFVDGDVAVEIHGFHQKNEKPPDQHVIDLRRFAVYRYTKII